ncbi:MAG: TetR/AcrR family transcriptional regulator [Candidatus Marinimicrobia bacterium]|nr:TetR/AcrR family transcriptional regulator [Candidatus Neomarinimicrobiota bacterium]MCF7828383.1 TetR/AcrR family transcriptional regulator [Candidatus Neomarinimicrobiota bacterium]MCF7881023.1 TetR/AcrR family transcriptional regulator [Candidatus Neomarinimicrobiota bacterium]
MSKDPKNTREKILNVAHSLILDLGFSGTTVDAVIEKTGVSKGAFFHHFSSKDELGRILVQRYAEGDAKHLEETLDKAEDLSDDPLQQLLIFVKLFEQEMKTLDEPYPGCLFASYLNQSELFDDQVMEIIRNSMLHWRHRVSEKLKEVDQQNTPRIEVDYTSLADMLLVIFEGAYVLSGSLKEPEIIANQLSHYHSYLRLLFREDT